MFDNLKKYNVILGSNSPRRRELLGGLGIDFTVKTIDCLDESFPPHLRRQEAAIYIATQKAEAFRDLLQENDLVITADTIVCVDDEILGKPQDEADAKRMLRTLSGRDHTVVTAVVVATRQRTEKVAVSTEVSFAVLSDDMIDYYISHYRPLDKAGAYGIQEWIGLVGVRGISGSMYNVIGLPVQRLCEILVSF